MSQVSRYEFEKLRHEQLTEKQLEEELTARGSNYAAVRHHHNIHKVGGGVNVTDGVTILILFRHWRLLWLRLWRMPGWRPEL